MAFLNFFLELLQTPAIILASVLVVRYQKKAAEKSQAA